MTKDKFMSFYKNTKYEPAASQCFDNILVALWNLQILTPLTLIGALATVRTEVGRYFLPIEEIASGAAYEGRTSLGNTHPGEGIKYKGRGYIQLTGRSNYEHYGTLIGVDLINHPELALDPVNSAKIFALYFKEKGVNVVCEQKDWVKVRKLVNGGDNGLTEFLSVVNQYLA